jgi:hypothetical protein
MTCELRIACSLRQRYSGVRESLLGVRLFVRIKSFAMRQKQRDLL